MRPIATASLFLLATLALSCAGPAQLARQSERALKAGNLRRAYELGRRAVDKDAASLPARRAMTAAAVQLVDQSKAEVVTAAAADTVAGARRALELRELEAEISRYSIELPSDPGFDERQRRIVDGAAAIEYSRGEQGLAARRPKEAYAHYRAAADFDASFRDVQERVRLAHEQGTTRVAIMPFENDVEIPGLSRTLLDAVYREVAARIGKEGLQFTELVDPDEIYASMTVKELDALTPEATWRIAKGLDAGRVVIGRFHGLRSRTDTWTYEYPIYHKITERDSSGRARDRWIETPFGATARERVVDARWELSVVDAATHAELAKRGDAVETFARAAWTDFRADGDCGDYRLVPPDREDDERGKSAEARWSECFGSWSLPDMLRRSREDRHRALYESRYRDEFRRDSRKRPVLCGELPSEEDMAYLAFEDLWQPVLAALKELDAKD